MASRKRIVLCYILLQASFWGMISSICAYQAAIVLDRGFTTDRPDSSARCAIWQACLHSRSSAAGLTGTRASPLKRLLIIMLLPAAALNLVFYFTRPGFLLTALIIFLFGVLETNSYPLIDSMGMQYVNAGVEIPYSFARGMGSLTYAVLCVVTGLLTARFGMQTALLAHCAEQLLLLVCLLAFPSIPARLLPQPQAKAASGHSIWQILKKKQGLYAHADCLLLRHDGRDADQQFPRLACKQPRRRQHSARRRAVFDGRLGAAVGTGVRAATKKDEQRKNSADLDHLHGGQAAADPRVRLTWHAAGCAAGTDAGLRPVLPCLSLFCQRIGLPCRPGTGPSPSAQFSPSRSVRCWAVSSPGI